MDSRTRIANGSRSQADADHADGPVHLSDGQRQQGDPRNPVVEIHRDKATEADGTQRVLGRANEPEDEERRQRHDDRVGGDDEEGEDRLDDHKAQQQEWSRNAKEQARHGQRAQEGPAATAAISIGAADASPWLELAGKASEATINTAASAPELNAATK